MQKTFVLVIVFALVCFSCSPRLAYQSLKTDNGFDITDTSGFYHASGFYIRVANSSKDIFIDIKVVDEGLQRKVLMSGLDVWTDPKGGEKKNYGVQFSAASPSNDIKPGKKGVKPDMAKEKQKMVNAAKLDPPYLEGFSDFASIKTEINLDDKGNLYYHVRIPLSELYDVAKFSTSTKPVKLAVGILSGVVKTSSSGEMGDGPRPDGNSGASGGGMSPGGGMGGGQPGGGPGGGGMGGGPMGGGNPPDADKKQESVEFWMKAQLYRE